MSRVQCLSGPGEVCVEFRPKIQPFSPTRMPRVPGRIWHHPAKNHGKIISKKFRPACGPQLREGQMQFCAAPPSSSSTSPLGPARMLLRSAAPPCSGPKLPAGARCGLARMLLRSAAPPCSGPKLPAGARSGLLVTFCASPARMYLHFCSHFWADLLFADANVHDCAPVGHRRL